MPPPPRPPRPPRPPGVQAILDEIAQQRPGFVPLDALNQHLARRMQEYNATPQPDLGGLSPIQVQQLLTGDWATTGALRVADDMSFDELRHVPVLADARTLMRYVAGHAPVKLTSLGNLSRAAVSALVPQLRMVADEDDEADEERRAPIPPFPIRNEGDALWLVILRHVLRFAKLLARRKGLVLTKRGQQLLDDGQAGALYALLFRTFFRQFDLRFLCNDDRYSVFERCILQPLVMFGLLERRREPGTKRREGRLVSDAVAATSGGHDTPHELVDKPDVHGSPVLLHTSPTACIGNRHFPIMSPLASDPRSDPTLTAPRLRPYHPRQMAWPANTCGPPR